MFNLKGQCREILCPFLSKDSIWAPYEQAINLYKNLSFSQRYADTMSTYLLTTLTPCQCRLYEDTGSE